MRLSVPPLCNPPLNLVCAYIVLLLLDFIYFRSSPVGVHLVEEKSSDQVVFDVVRAG